MRGSLVKWNYRGSSVVRLWLIFDPHHILQEPVECGVGSWVIGNLEQGLEQVGENVPIILHALVGLVNIKQSGDLDQSPHVVWVNIVLDGPLCQLVPFIQGPAVDEKHKCQVLVLGLLKIIENFIYWKNIDHQCNYPSSWTSLSTWTLRQGWTCQPCGRCSFLHGHPACPRLVHKQSGSWTRTLISLSPFMQTFSSPSFLRVFLIKPEKMF